jgi:fermentation-respiration switch protein FrsA (DUF1100 family)
MAGRARLVFLMRRRALLPLAAGAFLAGCDGLLFYPWRQPLLEPDRLGLAYRDVWFRAEDGVRLHGWFLPARGTSRGTVLFFHGNAQNIGAHLPNVAWLPGRGFSVLLFDYRGYGRSEGTPSLDGVDKDGEAAFGAVLDLEGVDPTRVVVLGQSLGGSIAISALARFPDRQRFRGLVVEGAVASYRQVAQEKLASLWLTWPFQVPLSWTISDSPRPVDDIARLAPLPVLIVQDGADPVIPPDQASELHAAAGPPKTFWRVPGVGHIQALAEPANQDRLVAWILGCAFGGVCPATLGAEDGGR